MVNFNPGEFRGFHGRWMLGGEAHPHLRRRRGLLGAAEHAVGGIEKDAAKSERATVRAERTSSAEIRRAAEATARSRGISSSMFRQAEKEAGVGQGAEKSAAGEGKKEARKTTRSRSAQARRLLGRNRYGGRRGGRIRPGAGLLRAAALARLFRGTKKSTASTKIRVPGVPTAKKAAKPKAKAKAKAKTAAKPKAAAKPRTIRPPKAPTGKRTSTGKQAGKGVAQKVTPSSQVMANLSRYVNAPGGTRAGVGTAGRSSMRSTGISAGSRSGAGRSLAVGRH
jgi:hypothetical protein